MKENSASLILVLGAAIALALFFFCSAGADGHSPAASYLAPGPAPGDSANRGFRFEESSTVTGSGEVSIKEAFHDRSVDSSGWMKGSGSINFESLRNMSKIRQEVEFSQRGDLVFTGGQLKNKKKMNLPLFENGTGASVSERFNISHLDRSETSTIRSLGRHNNSMSYDTELAFDGKWDVENRRGWSIFMNRSKQSYTGSFQTQKKIEFDDTILSKK